MKNGLGKIIWGLAFLWPASALAHGEDKLGPNGGYIRMPGVFHTEVVAKPDKLEVYLLDIEWKNPTIKDSNVDVKLSDENKTKTLACSPERNRFVCKLENNSLRKGQLTVTAKRGKDQGAPAIYSLPLKLEGSAMPSASGHRGH